MFLALDTALVTSGVTDRDFNEEATESSLSGVNPFEYSESSFEATSIDEIEFNEGAFMSVLTWSVSGFEFFFRESSILTTENSSL